MLYIMVNLRIQVLQGMVESLFYKIKPLPEQMLGNINVKLKKTVFYSAVN